jgi:dUTP pyrophosphatase
MLKVKFKKLNDDVKLPVKGSLHATCFDVYASSISYTQDSKVIVGLGFSTEIPEGWRGVIVPRSNLTKHTWVMNNSMGIIDSDYRGEWKVVFTKIFLEFGFFPYVEGDRVAQIYFEPVHQVEFEEVAELNESDRGIGGFGSTGVK